MHAEVIYRGGPVYSGHLGWKPQEALATAGGRVLAIGTESEVMQRRGPQTRVVELEGRALLPGLIDAHLHILGYALTLDLLYVAGLPSLQAMRERVAAEAARRPAGEWIIGRGWDQDRWAERREPTKEDLDAVSPDHPVYLQRNCNHVAVVNSAALRAAGITRETPDPEGGKIDRDPVTGEPTGMLRETAQALIQRVIPQVDGPRRRQLLERAMREALSYGITQLHTDDCRYGGGLEAVRELFTSMVGPDRIPLRITQMILMEDVERAAAQGVKTGAGDEWFRWGQVKIFADGSLGGRTAALLEPYADDPSTRGIYIHPAEEFKALVAKAHALGNQVGAHCIGDGGAQLFIEAVAEAQRKHPRPDARHRMIHCQILNEGQMDRMVEEGIVGDIQPVFLKSDGYWFADRVGPERARTSYAWRSLLEKGVPLCGGSDCPIEPLNIWYGIYCAVTRKDLNGYPEGGWQPEQRLTVAEALDMYTTGASYSTFEEYFKGALAPGMAADLIVVDRDPFTCDPDELKDVQVLLTVVGGVVAHEA
ncbi:MAG: amidohydrolase [Bacillota bacterium]